MYYWCGYAYATTTTTYLIAGPENINSETILKNETKESALIRLVTDFAYDGLDVFQLRCKNFSKNELYKIAGKIGSNLINTKCKFCINDDVDVTIMLKEKVNILHLGQDDMHPIEAKKMMDPKSIPSNNNMERWSESEPP